MIQLSEVHKAFLVKDRRTRSWRRIEAVTGHLLQGGARRDLWSPGAQRRRQVHHPEDDRGAHAAGPGAPRDLRFQLPWQNRSGAVPWWATSPRTWASTRASLPGSCCACSASSRGWTRKVAERRGLGLLEQLRLEEFADIRMEGFSAGQKQKVSIARALLHDPKVVIFDEPTTGLDVFTAKTVLDLLRILRAEGRAVIVSTHVMPMVEDICDRIGILFDGDAARGCSPGEDAGAIGGSTASRRSSSSSAEPDERRTPGLQEGVPGTHPGPADALLHVLRAGAALPAGVLHDRRAGAARCGRSARSGPAGSSWWIRPGSWNPG